MDAENQGGFMTGIAKVGDEVMRHTGVAHYTPARIEEVIITDRRPLYRLSDGAVVPSYMVYIVRERITAA